MTDDAQIDTKINGLGFQFKFKPNAVSVHSDMGTYNKTIHCANSKNMYAYWINPYMSMEASRGLKMNSLFVGTMWHLNNCIRNNVR